MFDTVSGLVLLVLWLGTLALKGYAFIDCLRRPAGAFPAVDRQTKLLWLVLTGLAAVSGLVPGLTLSIVGMAALVATLVYLFGVRPRIVAITG